jgi:hypothetical protein
MAHTDQSSWEIFSVYYRWLWIPVAHILKCFPLAHWNNYALNFAVLIDTTIIPVH